MKPFVLVGIVLIVLGVVALAYEGVTYTSREKIIDVGPLKATVDRQRTIPLCPVFGVLVLVGGAILVVTGRRQF